jgi:hypothetical protein
MNSLHYDIIIRAPKTRVHQLMLADQTYREWTNEFAQGSYYQGTWAKGAQILFLSPEGSGMNARIAENRPAEFVSIEILSEVREGVPNAQRQWHDAFENYTFTEWNGITTLQVDISGLPDEWAEYLNAAWPKALAKLKTICELS